MIPGDQRLVGAGSLHARTPQVMMSAIGFASITLCLAVVKLECRSDDDGLIALEPGGESFNDEGRGT